MTKLQIKKLALSIFFCTSIFSATQSSAALVGFSVDGEITSATADNIFGLSIGESITAFGEYDDSTIAPGVVAVAFSSATNNMQITVGSTTYTDLMDTLGGADLYFLDGAFDGLDYKAMDGNFDSWGTLGALDPNNNLLEDFTGSGIGGFWTESSFQVSPVSNVPLPAAVWLFGSGLVLLSGLARRRQK